MLHKICKFANHVFSAYYPQYSSYGSSAPQSFSSGSSYSEPQPSYAASSFSGSSYSEPSPPAAPQYSAVAPLPSLPQLLPAPSLPAAPAYLPAPPPPPPPAPPLPNQPPQSPLPAPPAPEPPRPDYPLRECAICLQPDWDENLKNQLPPLTVFVFKNYFLFLYLQWLQSQF